MEGEWIKNFPAAITVCDRDGIIIEMNERSCAYFAKEGGRDLIGKNLLDCHPAKAREKIVNMLKEQKSNCYTIEKAGKKKLIYQNPWYKDGNFMGIVEIIIELPADMPNFIRG